MRKLAVWVTATMLVTVLLSGCNGETGTATPTPEATIPAGFTTYTSEGLFSISYPSHWEPAASLDEIVKGVRQELKSLDTHVSVEERTMLFSAGEPYQDECYPFVNIMVEPRSIGCWTLDEVVEAGDAFSRAYTRGYELISRTKTIVDGREAVIDDYVDNQRHSGKWRYLIMITVKDELIWVVACGSEYDDFESYEDTFEAIVRSLQILG